MHWS